MRRYWPYSGRQPILTHTLLRTHDYVDDIGRVYRSGTDVYARGETLFQTNDVEFYNVLKNH